MESESQHLQYRFAKKTIDSRPCVPGAFTFLLKNYPEIINELFSSNQRFMKSLIRQSSSKLSVTQLKLLLRKILESAVSERDFCCKASQVVQ